MFSNLSCISSYSKLGCVNKDITNRESPHCLLHLIVVKLTSIFEIECNHLKELDYLAFILCEWLAEFEVCAEHVSLHLHLLD